MAGSSKGEKKGHICPPSDAVHPSDRWEALFVYSFVCKFTNLRGKVQGLETPMDFENALLSKEPDDILSRILAQFVLNLKPQTRNLSIDQISTTVASVLAEYFKTSERTVFWNDDLKANVDPFDGLDGGFFGADWDFKLKILRQLVELQLTHSTEIKAIIDRAWGVVHNKHKKKDVANAPPHPSDPTSQESLLLLPVGQDSQRKRYWIVDDSPRIYVSTNPWKITATLRTISSTREEYISVVEQLKSSAPLEPKKGHKRSKPEQAHIALIAALEGRIEAIDTELARVQRVRRKLEQKRSLLAQAELRETRTRRRTQKPDYVYNDAGSEDDGDEYKYEEDVYDEFEDDDFLNFRSDNASGSRRRRGESSAGQRRSTRNAALNANNKREGSSDSWQWRGERRSSRLGGISDTQGDSEPPYKRARTEDSVASGSSVDAIATVKSYHPNKLSVKVTGAAALKPTEVAMEEIAGKKRSKYWLYAVEPVAGSASGPVAPGIEEDSGMEVEKTEKEEMESGHHKQDGDSDQTSASSEQVVTPEPPEKMNRIEGRKGEVEDRLPALALGSG